MTNPARDAEVVRLRALGLSYRKIAARVGTSLGGVQRALRRAQDQTIADELERLRQRRAQQLTEGIHP